MSIKDKYFIQLIDRADYKMWLLKKHYAHRIPLVVYAFGLYIGLKLVGVCTFGIPPQRNCMLFCGYDYKDKTLELNRLIKNDGLGKNVQTFFVGQCLKSLPKPMVIVSYADPNYGHYGYTYQALNFMFTGNGGSNTEFVFKGKQFTSRHLKKHWFESRGFHFDENKTIVENFICIGGEVIKMKPKMRYVYFLGNKRQKKDMLRNFKLWILPYPKGVNERYDASYSPKIRPSLFLGVKNIK